MVNETTQKRTPRALETREQEARPMTWKPASTLPVPQEQEGYKFRWIRRSMMGQEDPTNVSKKRREGWEPVRADEYPDYEAPVIDEGKYAGVIGNGGLMLCRIPEETVHERSADYGNRTREQMQAVDQDLMKDQHPSMPISSSRQSRVSFGGRRSDAE